jgi:6,7-dimethyl-8-ribityllumazine synthase
MSEGKHFYPTPSHELPVLPEGVSTFVGNHDGAGKKFGIASGRFNIRLTGALVTSAVNTLLAQGVEAQDIAVVWVPGSYELPLALKRLHARFSPDALIPCGVVIEGQTRHAEGIMQSITRSFSELSLTLDCPVIDAVVHAHTLEQAEKRCLTGAESRGAYAALAALECVSNLSD